MPVNKPTISHQLKSVKSQKPKATSIIHSNANVVPLSPFNRSHLVTGHNNSKSNVFGRTAENLVDMPPLSNSQYQKFTKILRNMLSSEENKSTSTDDSHNYKLTTSQSGPIDSPDLSHNAELRSCPVNQNGLCDRLDELTDADSLTSISHPKPAIVSDNLLKSEKPIYSQFTSNQTKYCCCSNPLVSMHDSRLPHGCGDPHKPSTGSGTGDVLPVCTRCHNIILPPDKTVLDGMAVRKGRDDEYIAEKVPDFQSQNQNKPASVACREEYSATPNYTDKAADLMTYLHLKINELQSIARVTRDADTSRIVCEIERAFQQMIRENYLLQNHLKTVAKTIKWENSALKQKVKNHTESNRDMKTELKHIRQEQKQKIEELKLELQLKTEENRLIIEHQKNNSAQLKEKYCQLEKEHEKLKSEFQGQILQACHKDTDIIQLKHVCSQNEAKLKDEIHALTLTNQNLKQELQTCQTLCRKYEQETHHNQTIIKAAREQVVNLLDRHKQNRGLDSNSCSFRFEPSSDMISVSGDWINQAANLQQVLSMATDIRDKQLSGSGNNQHCSLLSSEQSNIITSSNSNFTHTNFNNNYVSPSTYGHIPLDTANHGSIAEGPQCQQPHTVLNMPRPSQSPSNISSSTLSDCSLGTSGEFLRIENLRGLADTHETELNSRHYSGSSEGSKYDPWSLPAPSGFRKVSSTSSMMSTVSSFRLSDDREFRKGLKRLDSQISRLQNTLQSNLQCK